MKFWISFIAMLLIVTDWITVHSAPTITTEQPTTVGELTTPASTAQRYGVDNLTTAPTTMTGGQQSQNGAGCRMDRITECLSPKTSLQMFNLINAQTNDSRIALCRIAEEFNACINPWKSQCQPSDMLAFITFSSTFNYVCSPDGYKEFYEILPCVTNSNMSQAMAACTEQISELRWGESFCNISTYFHSCTMEAAKEYCQSTDVNKIRNTFTAVIIPMEEEFCPDKTTVTTKGFTTIMYATTDSANNSTGGDVPTTDVFAMSNATTESYISQNFTTESYVLSNTTTKSYFWSNASTESYVSLNATTESYVSSNATIKTNATESYLSSNATTESYVSPNVSTTRLYENVTAQTDNENLTTFMNSTPASGATTASSNLPNVSETTLLNTTETYTNSDNVTTSQNVTTTESITTPTMHDIKIENISPSSTYFTKSENTSPSSSYVTQSENISPSSPYVTQSENISPSTSYVTKTVTISASLSSYVTQSENISPSTSYVTKTETISASLSSYVTQSEYISPSSQYITQSEYISPLTSYIPESEIISTSMPYVIATEVLTTVPDVTTTRASTAVQNASVFEISPNSPDYTTVEVSTTPDIITEITNAPDDTTTPKGLDHTTTTTSLDNTTTTEANDTTSTTIHNVTLTLEVNTTTISSNVTSASDISTATPRSDDNSTVVAPDVSTSTAKSTYTTTATPDTTNTEQNITSSPYTTRLITEKDNANITADNNGKILVTVPTTPTTFPDITLPSIKTTARFHAPPFQCYECHSGAIGSWQNERCPPNGNITGWATIPHPCNGPCVSMVTMYPEGDVYRACSLNYYFPNPPPTDGCIRYQQELYCFCSSDRCNNMDMVKDRQQFIKDKQP